METKDKKILVTGATGQQGGAAARHLLDRGFHVLALTRNPSKQASRDLMNRGAEIVRGDMNDPGSFARSLDGAYGVFSVQNPEESGIDSEIWQGTALADAAMKAGVRHFVYTSVAGANLQTGIPFFDSKWTIEEHVREIGLPFTMLRPVFFMENWQNYFREPIMSGTLALPLDPDTVLPMIAVEDIGGFAAMVFENPDEWIGEEVELAGDERTLTQVAETFTRLLRRPVKYVQVPWGEFQKQAGEDMTKMYRWLNDMEYHIDIDALRRVYPQLATLEQVLQRENWQERLTA